MNWNIINPFENPVGLIVALIVIIVGSLFLPKEY